MVEAVGLGQNDESERAGFIRARWRSATKKRNKQALKKRDKQTLMGNDTGRRARVDSIDPEGRLWKEIVSSISVNTPRRLRVTLDRPPSDARFRRWCTLTLALRERATVTMPVQDRTT